MFYDRFEALCAKHGVTPSKAATEAGINKSAVTYWKTHEDAKPTGQIAEKLCAYFGITMSELYGDAQREKAPSDSGEGSVPHAQYREILAGEGIRLLLDADAKVPQEHLDDIVEFIKFKQQQYGR